MEISRSEQKRRAQQLEHLAAALVSLPAHLFPQLPCPPDFADELRKTTAMKGGARKRQLKYLARLLRTAETQEELYRFVDRHQGRTLTARREERQLEQYRNALLTEVLAGSASSDQDQGGEWWESPTLQELRQWLPGVDARVLLRLARRFAQTHDPRYSREIFRLLRAALEREKRNQTEAPPG